MWALIFLGLLAFSVWLFLKGKRLEQVVNRYEFENRTDGGVVKFKTYEDSLAHEKRQKRVGDYYVIALMIAGVSVVALAMITIWS